MVNSVRFWVSRVPRGVLVDRPVVGVDDRPVSTPHEVLFVLSFEKKEGLIFGTPVPFNGRESGRQGDGVKSDRQIRVLFLSGQCCVSGTVFSRGILLSTRVGLSTHGTDGRDSPRDQEDRTHHP